MPILKHFLILSLSLFSIGLYGLITRRNAIAILMSLELLFNSININMIAFSRFFDPSRYGEIFAIMIIAVAAAESAVGLAIILLIYKKKNTANADDVNLLRG